MMRIRAFSTLLLTALAVGLVGSQPPDEGQPGKHKGPKYQSGKLFPKELRESLHLTPEQVKELETIEMELRGKLDGILTPEQKKTAEAFTPRGGKGGPGMDLPSAAIRLPEDPPGPRVNVVKPLALTGKTLGDLTGDAFEGTFGNPAKERFGRGIRFPSGDDLNKDGLRGGKVSWTVGGLTPTSPRWLRIRIRALVQDGFAVGDDALFIKVDFAKDGGKNPLDGTAKSIYPQVERERKDLADAGTNRSLGLAAWRTYGIDIRLPFAEIDTLRVSVGYDGGSGKGEASEFWLSEIDIAFIPDPTAFIPPIAKPAVAPIALKSLIKLGGRWYYDPRGDGPAIPARFDHTNADRIVYLTDRLEVPFGGNTSAWLRAGWRDRAGKTVEKDEFVPDNVVIRFTDKHLVMESKNLPNHPTGTFPDRTRFLDGNPNIIREQARIWYLPLEPRVALRHVAMDANNSNSALPGGPIGVAVNGVVFFNPFDHMEDGGKDAVWRLDRCCGHPNPNSEYHYHKYPVCVNTPWNDDGSAHSPLIGFAFDGFPVYGPYEAAGVLAKDSKTNALNDFNLHVDSHRGPHYHVTPGKYPHIIGGYWGEVELLNRGKKGPRPGG